MATLPEPWVTPLQSRSDTLATFNAISKWAQGISDTLALGVLNEALCSGISLHAFANVKAQLAAHPSYKRHLHLFREAGVIAAPFPVEMAWPTTVSRIRAATRLPPTDR